MTKRKHEYMEITYTCRVCVDGAIDIKIHLG